MRTIIFLLGVTFFCLSCKKQPVDGQDCLSFDRDAVTVTLNQCFIDENVKDQQNICFFDLNDSRCPANADCVWQGVAIAKFKIMLDNNLHQVTLATTKFPGTPSTDTTVAGYKIQPLSVTPYPGTSTTPKNATLRITK